MNLYCAQLPVFTNKNEIYGYELVFKNRSEKPESGKRILPDAADPPSCVFAPFEISDIPGGKPGLIAFPAELITLKSPSDFTENPIIVQILKQIRPDKRLFNAIFELNNSGCAFKTCARIEPGKKDPVFSLSNILKVDFRATPFSQLAEVIPKIKSRGLLTLLAGNINLKEELNAATQLGFSLFQGRFFMAPDPQPEKELSPNQVSKLNLISETARAELDFIQIEKQIKNDAALSFRLLKYINSAFFKRRVPIDTIKDALAYLGEDETRKFLYMAAIADVGKSKPDELVRISIVRAYMSESCAGILKTKFTKDELFMLGLFSLMDALMDKSMQDILKVVTFSNKMKNALSGNDMEFAQILDIIAGFEAGSWDAGIFEIMKDRNIEEILPRLYVHSIRSANAFYGF